MQSRPWIRGKLNRAALVVTAISALNGCNGGCNATACINGLRVHFMTAPAVPIQVELLVGGQVQEVPMSTYCGAPSGCQQDVFFANALPSMVTLRITTAAGTRLIENVQPKYEKTHLDGACVSDCRVGTFNVPLS